MELQLPRGDPDRDDAVSGGAAGGGDADVQGALACQKVVVAQQNGFKSLKALDEVAADVAEPRMLSV